MKAFIALCAATLVGALPVGASATSAEHVYNLRTRIVEQSPGVGEYDGSLQLHVSADGYVSGFYRPDDNPRFVPVTGGVSNDRFWIDIGTFALRPVHFNVTFCRHKDRRAGERPVFGRRSFGWTVVVRAARRGLRLTESSAGIAA
jgi:hypothetical protein